MPVEAPPELHALLQQLSERGFVKVGGLLSHDQVQVVGQEVQRLLDEDSLTWDHYTEWAASGVYEARLFAGPNRDSALFDFMGKSPVVDEVIEAALSSPVVQHLLRCVLGSGYRIWYNQARRANPEARALRMHQDRPGEVSLSILLSDTPTTAGTTSFLPRSHRWPRVLESFPCSPRTTSGTSSSVRQAYPATHTYSITRPGMVACARMRSREHRSSSASFPATLLKQATFPQPNCASGSGHRFGAPGVQVDAGPIIPPATEDLRHILDNSSPVAALSLWRVALAASWAWEAAHTGARWVKRIAKRK